MGDCRSAHDRSFDPFCLSKIMQTSRKQTVKHGQHTCSTQHATRGRYATYRYIHGSLHATRPDRPLGALLCRRPFSPFAAQAAADAHNNQVLQKAARSLISNSTGIPPDVSSLVPALVNDKIAGPTAALAARSSIDDTQISALALLSATMCARE